MFISYLGTPEPRQTDIKSDITKSNLGGGGGGKPFREEKLQMTDKHK